jgi:hypothetical protein
MLARELDLRRPLRVTAAQGFAHVSHAVVGSSLRSLRRELERGPFQRFEGSFGQVRQEIEGYDVLEPMHGFPRLAELRDELAGLLRRNGRGIVGMATWWPNEAGVARYRPASIGITPHLDGKWYRRLVVVVTVNGTAPFSVCGDRGGEVIERWDAGPGSLTLMRAPGLGGHRDGRPFHTVDGPRRGNPMAIGVPVNTPPPPTAHPK